MRLIEPALTPVVRFRMIDCTMAWHIEKSEKVISNSVVYPGGYLKIFDFKEECLFKNKHNNPKYPTNLLVFPPPIGFH